nr:MAG TPA: hypothetical protein [Caudoviricetes sp.]
MVCLIFSADHPRGWGVNAATPEPPESCLRGARGSEVSEGSSFRGVGERPCPRPA